MTTPHRPPPSHVRRRMAYLRSAGHAAGMAFDVWIEQQWHAFCRLAGRSRRSGITQAEFDMHLEKAK